jgi:hypothetical protein
MTKELIMDCKKRRAEHSPIHIDGAVVEGVESLNKLTWSKHTKTVVKRARQHIFPFRRLK